MPDLLRNQFIELLRLAPGSEMLSQSIDAFVAGLDEYSVPKLLFLIVSTIQHLPFSVQHVGQLISRVPNFPISKLLVLLFQIHQPTTINLVAPLYLVGYLSKCVEEFPAGAIEILKEQLSSVECSCSDFLIDLLPPSPSSSRDESIVLELEQSCNLKEVKQDDLLHNLVNSLERHPLRILYTISLLTARRAFVLSLLPPCDDLEILEFYVCNAPFGASVILSSVSSISTLIDLFDRVSGNPVAQHAIVEAVGQILWSQYRSSEEMIPSIPDEIRSLIVYSLSQVYAIDEVLHFLPQLSDVSKFTTVHIEFDVFPYIQVCEAQSPALACYTSTESEREAIWKFVVLFRRGRDDIKQLVTSLTEDLNSLDCSNTLQIVSSAVMTASFLVGHTTFDHLGHQIMRFGADCLKSLCIDSILQTAMDILVFKANRYTMFVQLCRLLADLGVLNPKKKLILPKPIFCGEIDEVVSFFFSYLEVSFSYLLGVQGEPSVDTAEEMSAL